MKIRPSALFAHCYIALIGALLATGGYLLAGMVVLAVGLLLVLVS